MTSESRHDRLTVLFGQALTMPVTARDAFLEEQCGDDTELRTELRSLLQAHDSSVDYFERLNDDLILPAVSALPISGGRSTRDDLIPALQHALGAGYLVERELLGGGMSRVFLTTELGLDRQVVVKVLPKEMAVGMNAESFRREIQLSAKLQHPHIVPVLASNAAEELVYYTMPFVAGESLRARLAAHGALPIADALAVWRSVLDALSHAHRLGVVHRDIKPDNILLSGRSAVVADFGIAVALAAAADGDSSIAQAPAIGTPSYMAPELVAGKRADHRIDIYAAGLVMYEMLEGHRPFPGLDTRELLAARARQSPPPLQRADVPPSLATLVLRCIAIDADDRPQSADAVLDELEKVGSAASPVSKRPHRGWRVAAAVFLVATVGLLGYEWRTRFTSERFDDPRQSDSRPSLAVLPLEVTDGDSSNSYFADVLTAALLEKLTAEGMLRVIQGPSVFFFKGHQTPPQEIADSLGVDNVLVGAVSTEGSSVKLRLRLVRNDGSVRWARTYTRSHDDVFALEDSIRRSVDQELLPNRSTASQRSRALPKPAAYELYQRGRYEENQQERQGTLMAAITHYSRAVREDTAYAEAYAALAIAYAFVATGNVSDFPYALAIDSARYFANKAIALDDSIAEAYEARAFVKLLYDYDWAGTETDRNRAIEVNPYYNRRIHVGAALHQWRGDYAKAVKDLQLTLASDPMSPATRGELARTLFFNRQHTEALAHLDSARAINGGKDLPRLHLTHGEILLNQKRYAEAIREFTSFLDAAPEAAAPRAFLVITHARAGDRAKAESLLQDVLARWRSGRSNAFYVAMSYAGLRDHDNAFRWLDSAYADRSLRPLIMDPTFDELRADRRFNDLLVRIGLRR